MFHNRRICHTARAFQRSLSELGLARKARQPETEQQDQKTLSLLYFPQLLVLCFPFATVPRFVSLSLQCPVECRRAAFRTHACAKQVSLQGGCDCNLTGVSRIAGVSGGPEKKRLLDCSLATGSSTNALGCGIVNRHIHRLLVFESKPKSSILVQDFSGVFRALLRPDYRMFSIE